MKLTTRCRYGSRALSDIAAHHSSGPVKIRDISERQEIPQSYLENILCALKRAGLISSERGAAGGYRLGRNPEEIRLWDLFIALDEKPEPAPCTSSENECTRKENCATRKVWNRLQEAQIAVLKETKISDLI